MQIFDGVETAPPQHPVSAPRWLSVVQLVFNALVAAEQCRQERLAAEGDRPGAFEQVMAQVGLKIPGLEEVLAQLMGNGEEARTAASMIASSSDPLSLLQQFAKRFAADAAMNASAPPGEPREAPRADGVKEQPSAAAASSSEADASPVAPWEQPDFESRAREAIRAAEAADTGIAPHQARPAANGAMPKFLPEFVPKRAVQGPTSTPSSAPTRPSLVGAVKRQLEALRRRMDAQQAELDARLTRAEAELTALRDDLRRRSRPNLVVVPASDDEVTSPVSDEHRPQDAQAEPSPATHPAEPPRVMQEPTRPVEADGSPQPDVETTPPTEGAAALPAAELPSSASDGELAEALGLVADLGAEVDVRYQRGLDRIGAIEHETRVLRAELRAETTELAVEGALS